MARRRFNNPLFAVLKHRRHRFDADEMTELFSLVSEARINSLSRNLSEYIGTNLPAAFERRSELSHYRTNPYVLMTTASVMNLDDPAAFGTFLFNSKLYMALETSFGKSVEAAFVAPYPLNSESKWMDAPEKIEESTALEGLSREERARRRTASVWREIDKSCVVGNKRFITSIKSGPNTINDTQVQGMTRAIIDNCETWLEQSQATYPHVDSLDVVLGLTYGTDRTTNNKENQILVKLLEHGFVEEDRGTSPGTLIHEDTHAIRVYRRIGKEFWAFIGQPDSPHDTEFVFLEILLSLAKALSSGIRSAHIEDRINERISHLVHALGQLRFPRRSLPSWIRDDFSDDQLFWFATAMSAFFDDGDIDGMEKELRDELRGGKFSDVGIGDTRRMAAIGSTDNASTERRLRMALVRARVGGWKLNQRDLVGRPDFYFPESKLAVFTDGCFWHGCPICGRLPSKNAGFWSAKIRRNRSRDVKSTVELRKQGIKVLRLWEHKLRDDLEGCVEAVRRMDEGGD